MTAANHPYGRPLPEWPTRRLGEWTWCVEHDAIADQPAETPNPACFAAQVAHLLAGEQPAGCRLVPLYVPTVPQIVGAGDAGSREARTDHRHGAPAPAPAPFELTPGVFQLDASRLDVGPSTPPHLLDAVVDRAAAAGTVVRCHAPSLELLQRVTLAAHDRRLVAVFTLHGDGDRADITFHPAGGPT